MTPDDLRDVLRRLADHIHTIREDLQDSGLPPASGTSSGASSKAPGPRDPCNLTSLSRMVEDVEAKVWGWCVNLSDDLSLRLVDHRGIHLIEHEAHGSAWCAWLNRYRAKLLDRPWADDCVVELSDLEAELREEIHPAPAARAVDMPSIVTVDYLVERGFKAATVRQWRHRGILVEVGSQFMSSGETVTLYRFM